MVGLFGIGLRITRTSGRVDVGGRSGRALHLASSAAACVARRLVVLVFCSGLLRGKKFMGALALVERGCGGQAFRVLDPDCADTEDAGASIMAELTQKHWVFVGGYGTTIETFSFD